MVLLKMKPYASKIGNKPFCKMSESELAQHIMSTVCKTLAQMRLRSNINQKDICAACGISQPYLSKVESGKYRICIQLIQRIHLFLLSKRHGKNISI